MEPYGTWPNMTSNRVAKISICVTISGRRSCWEVRQVQVFASGQKYISWTRSLVTSSSCYLLLTTLANQNPFNSLPKRSWINHHKQCSLLIISHLLISYSLHLTVLGTWMASDVTYDSCYYVHQMVVPAVGYGLFGSVGDLGPRRRLASSFLQNFGKGEGGHFER